MVHYLFLAIGILTSLISLILIIHLQSLGIVLLFSGITSIYIAISKIKEQGEN